MPFQPRGDNWHVLRSLVTLALATLLIAACGSDVFKAPKPTAGDFTDVVSGLVRRGMTVTTQVAGDAGCAGTPAGNALHNNAVRYDVRAGSELMSLPVYVFVWKSQATFDADKPTFDACAGANASGSGTPVETVERLPWRAYGPWPDSLRAAVDAALTEAGGVPAPVEPE